MSYQTTRRWAKAAMITCALLLVLASVSLAGTESTNDPWLVFRVGSDSAAINDYEDDDTLFMPFQLMKADGDGSDTIIAVETRIMYDAEILTLQSVDVNATNWPYNFSYVDTTVGDTNYIFMLFEDTTGVGIPAVFPYIEMAVMQFTFNCVDSIGTSTVEFLEGDNLNWADYKLGGIYDPGIIVDGYARLKTFWCDLWIPDTTITQAIGDTITIPVWMHNNYKSYYTMTGVQFDTAAMQYVGTTAPGGALFNLGESQVDDQVVAFAWNLSGFPGYDTPNVLYYHHFVLDCDAWGDTLIFHFTDTGGSVGTCQKIPVDLSREDGEVIYRDTAYFSAEIVGADPHYYYDDIVYDLKLTNLFPAGDITAGHDAMAGIVVNVDLATFMEYDDVTSQHAEMAFEGTERDDYKVSLYQVIDTTLDNYMDPGTGVTMMRMSTHMTAAPTTLPTWLNPYITTVPAFVDTNTAAYDAAIVPNVECDGAATFDNGLLTGLDFPDALAAVCQIYNYADADFKGDCDSLDVYAKANVETDSIYFVMTVNSHLSLNDVSLASGITATQNGYNSLIFESDGSFSSFGPNDSIYVASVAIQCYNMLQNRYAQIVYSDIWAENDGDRIFTDASAGAVWVDCLYLCHHIQDRLTKGEGLPTTYALYQNYPNPFNPTTQIQLDLPEAAAWHIEIYNVLGQIVEEFDGQSGAGTVSVEWDASNHSTGVYLYRATAGDFVETKKMLLLK